MKKMIAVLCSVVMLASVLTGCGGKVDYSDSEYVGTWEATDCEYAGFVMDVSEVFESFVITLNADGTYSAVVDGEEGSGKWAETETGIKLDKDDEMTLTYKDGILVYDYVDDMKLNFEKQGASGTEETPEVQDAESQDAGDGQDAADGETTEEPQDTQEPLSTQDV